MKKFLLKVCLFLLVVALLDVLSGYVFAGLVGRAKGGDTGRNNYICHETHEDVLIFGSSRAFHHYNPVIITDSLGLTCYNCGQDGNGSILTYGRWQMIARRYHPKVLVLDLYPRFDLLEGEDNHKYLGHLRSYYDQPGVAEVFASVDRTEPVKMLSHLYRYNSKFVQIISDCIQPRRSVGIQGYRPIYQELDPMRVRERSPEPVVPAFDSLKVAYLDKIVDVSPETKVIFVVSPTWAGYDTAYFAPAQELCRQRGIPLLDFSNSPDFVHHNEYFKDGTHLNARGADAFTRALVTELKRRNILGETADARE